jgi:hypothetical protein
MNETLYRVRMRRPATLIVRTENGSARVDIPAKDKNEIDPTIAKVRLDVARDWVACHVADALDELPPKA